MRITVAGGICLLLCLAVIPLALHGQGAVDELSYSSLGIPLPSR